MGLFDGYFATPGGGILQGLTDPSGSLPPNGPQMWGGPGGYGLDDLSTGDPIAPYGGAKPRGGPATSTLLGFGPWLSSYTTPTAGPPSQSASAPAAVAQSPTGASNPSSGPPSPGSMPTGAAAPDDPSGGFLSRLGQALHDNSSMLMAMGGGMMTGGIGRGLQAGAAAAEEATSKRQAPQTVKVRRPDGGEMLMMWDPGQRRYVPAPMTGLTQPSTGAPASVTATGGYAEGTTATNPQTGQRIVFRNGRWQAM